MAVECDLGAMKGNAWLRMELVRGVNDTRLQKRLLQEQQATLPQLILIAKQWQAADGTKTAFGSEPTGYTRPRYNQLRVDRCQGCGAHVDKMHKRHACHAANRSCFNCDRRPLRTGV